MLLFFFRFIELIYLKTGKLGLHSITNLMIFA